MHYLDHHRHLLGEDVKEFDVAGNALVVPTVSKGGQPIDQGDDDVLHVDRLQEIGTGLQERVQRLEVELIGEDLRRERDQWMKTGGRRGKDYGLG